MQVIVWFRLRQTGFLTDGAIVMSRGDFPRWPLLCRIFRLGPDFGSPIAWLIFVSPLAGLVFFGVEIYPGFRFTAPLFAASWAYHVMAVRA